MAAFSTYQDNNMNPFLVDSVYLKIMSGLLMEDENNMAMNTNCFSQIYPQAQPLLQETSPCGPCDHSSKVDLSLDDDEHSVTRKQSSESSVVVDKLESGEQVTQKRKTRNGSGSVSGSRSTPNSAQSKDAREEKGKKKQKQCNGEAKEKQQQQQQKAKADKKDQKKPAAAATSKQQEPPTGYIHVRARRGQATDSHSLAERVRREKISERMQTLQRLVPGCDKVTGKALMLDEIINYVQSLQNQVDFLSMKLASVNPMFYDFSLEQDSFMDFNPEERLNSMHASPLPQCSPNQPTVFADTQPQATIRPSTSSYNNHVDTSAFSQDNASLLWDAEEEQGEKFLNPSGFSDNLCSFK